MEYMDAAIPGHIQAGQEYMLDVIGGWMDAQGRHWRFIPK